MINVPGIHMQNYKKIRITNFENIFRHCCFICWSPSMLPSSPKNLAEILYDNISEMF